MTLDRSPRQSDAEVYCELLRGQGRIGVGLGMLHRECFSLFPDEIISDLLTDVDRRSVPRMIVDVVMTLQQIVSFRTRREVDRFVFDIRWKNDASALDFK